MIRILDAVLLARTKLKVRRVRLFISLLSMSVMFAVLVFIANVATGVTGSLAQFGKTGYGGRFLVQAQPITYQGYDDDTLISRLVGPQQQLISQKQALAKKLDLDYDSHSDTSLYYIDQQTGPSASDVQHTLTGSAVATTALNAQNAAIPGIQFSDFTQRAVAAGATHVYRSSMATGSFNQSVGATAGTLSVLVNGKETFLTSNQQTSPTGVDSIETLGWNQMDDALLQPFLLKGQTTKVGANGAIPVFAPYSAAEQMLGLNPLPTTASSQQQLQRLEQVRQEIAGKTVQLCYRNNASETLLQNTITQQQTIAENKGKSGYTPPDLTYALPSVACGATTIAKDVRTTAEKQNDANQQQFDATFNPDAEPVQGIITLQIVGISPDVNSASSIGGIGVLGAVLSSTIGYGWFSPTSAFVPNSLATRAQEGTVDQQPIAQQVYYAEFSSLSAATAFTKRFDCTTGGTVNTAVQTPNTRAAYCASQGRPFMITPYGNNAGTILTFQHSLWRVLRFVLLAIIIIAIVIMGSTFGKVIADSRRETAVFRALGASRLAVSQIYFTYTLLIALIVSLLATILGTCASLLLNAHLSPGLSVDAVLIYNTQNTHMHFTLTGWDAKYLGIIVALVVVLGFASAALPLFSNMRRNPIRDLRDE